jgi:hypothetical protein
MSTSLLAADVLRRNPAAQADRSSSTQEVAPKARRFFSTCARYVVERFFLMISFKLMNCAVERLPTQGLVFWFHGTEKRKMSSPIVLVVLLFEARW